MVFDIDKKFTDIYYNSGVFDTLYTNYTRVSKNMNIRSLENDINEIAFEAYKFCHKDEYESSNISEGGLDSEVSMARAAVNNPDFCVFQFIALSGINAYYGLSNLNEFAKVGNEFGYSGAFNNIEMFCKLINKSGRDFKGGALERLVASERSCSVEKYITDGFYLEDIILIGRLLSAGVSVNIDDELNESIVNTFGTQIMETEIRNCVSVYNSLLSAAFGVDKYVGVVTFDKTNPVAGLTNSYRYKSVEPVQSLLKYYTPTLRPLLNAVVPSESSYSDRQFSIEVIYAGYSQNKDIPIYFPHKILEFVGLSGWTRTSANAYKACVNGESKNLTEYLKYIATNLEDTYFEFCAYACKKDFTNLSKDVRSRYDLLTILVDEDCPERAKFVAKIVDKLQYLTKCVTTAVIVTSLDTDTTVIRGVKKKDIISFRIKVSTSGELPDNAYFCRNLGKAIYKDSSRLSDCDPESPTSIAGVSLCDYSYTFNADKVYARPIFAYKALTSLQEQGLTVDWHNILLGKYADGSLCRSAEGQKINLSKRQLHNLYAGSRSGKGVMCFNIFATAIASSIPIFYCDRKPDTAVIMKSMAHNMFAVNGGQYDAVIDLEQQFDTSKINFRVPRYVETQFAESKVRNDYIYFRAMLLMFSLVVFMDKTVNTKDPRYQKISEILKNGAIFVFDEFSNFCNGFLTSKPTTQGWFQDCFSEQGIDQWRGILSGIQEKKAVLDAKSGGKPEQVVSAQNKLNNAVEDAKNFELHRLYFAALSDCYENLVELIPELFRAGGAMVKNMQIFIIGQTIPSEWYDGDTYFKKSNGASIKRFNSSTHDSSSGAKPDVPILHMLNEMNGDYILGYQPDNKGGKPAYLAQRVKGMTSSSMLTASRRCFCYHNPGKAITDKEAQKIKNTAAYFGHDEEGMKQYLDREFTYFKPFLILNNAIVPPEELLQPDMENLGVSTDLENKRAAKGGYSQYKDSQYIGQCLTTCNRAGLAWEDLLNDNKDADGALNKGVGFEGYIEQLCGSVPTDKMGLSGEVMNIFVQEVFGYKDGTWEDFLADFRPEALFKPTDFINAIDNPSEYSVKSRLRQSFFRDSLMKTADEYSFGSIFSEELGTLAQYYGQGTQEKATFVGDLQEDRPDGVGFGNFGLELEESDEDTAGMFTENAEDMYSKYGNDSGSGNGNGSADIEGTVEDSSNMYESTAGYSHDIESMSQHDRREAKRQQLGLSAQQGGVSGVASAGVSGTASASAGVAPKPEITPEIMETLTQTLTAESEKEKYIRDMENLLFAACLQICSENPNVRRRFSDEKLKSVSHQVAIIQANKIFG